MKLLISGVKNEYKTKHQKQTKKLTKTNNKKTQTVISTLWHFEMGNIMILLEFWHLLFSQYFEEKYW